MKKINGALIFKNTKIILKKNSPKILTVIGIAGMITTTIMSVRITPKAIALIEEKKNENNVEKLTFIETIKTTWKCYISSTITCVFSIICLIEASSVSAKRCTALATAYTLSESALKEYQKKVIEAIGEKKEQKIRDNIAKDKIDNHPIVVHDVIFTGKGDNMCYDAISGRYFKSDIDKLKKVVNELNKDMLNNTYISLNDFYYEIGLENIAIGDELGWNINNGFIDVYFSSQLTHDGTPCLVLNFRIAPRYNF